MIRIPGMLAAILATLSTICAYGQAHLIKGTVRDERTGEPIAFAHVTISGANKGTTTDLFGAFVLAVDGRRVEIQVSCLGYKPVVVRWQSGDSLPLIVELQQHIIMLDEVTVTPPDPIELLREARSLIPLNYDTVPSTVRGHYVLDTDLQGLSFRDLEAYIDIVKQPYIPPKNDETPAGDSIYWHEGRLKRDEVNDWKLRIMLPWERTVYFLEFRDVVKEFIAQPENFRKFIENYDFQLGDMVSINGRNAFQINLKSRKRSKKYIWNGSIYIDEETKAFVLIDLTSESWVLRRLKSEFSYIMSSALYKVTYESGEWKERIAYAISNGRWHLADIKSSKQFVISSKKRQIEHAPVTVNLSFDVSDVFDVPVDTLPMLPHHKKHPGQEDNFIRAHYDSVFWQRKDGTAMPAETFDTVDDTVSIRPYAFSKLDTLQGALTPIRSCFDVHWYDLHVEVFPDAEMLRGKSNVSFTVTKETSTIQLDLYSEMNIDRITANDQTLSFSRSFNAIFIDLPGTLKPGDRGTVSVEFRGRPVDVDVRIPMYGGFIWSNDLEGQPFLQAICQGYGASAWWPNKDHLSDEPDSASITVTAPSYLDIVANGRLIAVRDTSDNRRSHTWRISYPVNNYNLTFNAAQYEHLRDSFDGLEGLLDLDYYLLHEHAQSADDKLAIIKPMLATYEKYFGPYPFRRDGFKIVEAPHAMEHQSCVAIDADYFESDADASLKAGAKDLDKGVLNYQVILHETAHEWWGNAISCRDNADLWLHEGFATYAEVLFVEDHFGYEAGQKYMQSLREGIKNEFPVIGKPDVNHIHYDIGDMYAKGAIVINTFRHVLANDSLFFAMLKGLQQRFRYKTISTEMLVSYLNEISGEDFATFFDQYLTQTDIPVLALKEATTNSSQTLLYRWENTLSGFNMPVRGMVGRDEITITPTSEWQKLPIDAANDFLPLQELYYIQVKR